MNIGVFSGSFNPIHIGHLILANYIYEYSELEKILFIVSPHNPLKNSEHLLDQGHRLKMVELAVEDYPMFEASDFEFNLPKPSYTYNTLQQLKCRYPSDEFNLIMGADNWCNFTSWRNHQEILTNYRILVYPRMHHPIETSWEHNNISIINAPIVEISSTFIRKGIEENKNLKAFLPLKVFDYIEHNGLYNTI